MGIETTEQLAKMLETNLSIPKLDLTFNKMGPDAIRALLPCFEKNSSLISLWIQNNYIKSEGASKYQK
ncbi:MAG: hypothetical protein DGJ47_000695 [Rickettsiaceae bacterium]